MEETYKIRTMKRSDLDTAVEWAALEGWNPGLHDADVFFNTDTNGFFAGELNGEIISVISAVKYGNSFGFIGFYIVKPEFRGKGFGIKIWNHALNYLEGRNAGLDGVVEQQENYTKSGFRLAYRNMRFEGITGGDKKIYSGFTELKNIPFGLIENYDRKFFPEQRSSFLQSWINLKDSYSIGILESGELKGMGTIRLCRKGYKIGPLFADSPDIAEKIFAGLSSSVKPGEPLYLDIPEVNKNALKLVADHSMSFGFETARMYTGEFPVLNLNGLYGVTTFELG